MRDVYNAKKPETCIASKLHCPVRTSTRTFKNVERLFIQSFFCKELQDRTFYNLMASKYVD